MGFFVKSNYKIPEHHAERRKAYPDQISGFGASPEVTNDRFSGRHAERSEASLEVQEMINSTINRISRDPSCLPMT